MILGKIECMSTLHELIYLKNVLELNHLVFASVDILINLMNDGIFLYNF